MNKLQLFAALALGYVIGNSLAKTQAKMKDRKIINYYEKELMKKTLYADAMTWAHENVDRLSKEEVIRGLQQRLLFMRIVTNTNVGIEK